MNDDLFEPEFLDAIIIAYRNGLKADIVQGWVKGAWGTVWTVPPLSPIAMDKVGRQMTRLRADRVRYYRVALLRRAATKPSHEECAEVVILTNLPALTQIIVAIADGRRICVRAVLEDDALTALKQTFLKE